MPIQDVTDFLMAGGSKSAKFESRGDSVEGEIVGLDVQQQKDYATGTPLYWDDGTPRRQLRITLATTLRESEDDDGKRSVYAKGALQSAVRDAVKDAGAQTIVEGGWLRVQYVGDGVATKRGFSPPKQYRAAYRAPAAGAVSVDDLV